MSGFEIAGLVLGVIPLVVSTFENYKKGAQALENLRKYENNIQCLILNINVEQVRLQNVFERLLDGVVPPSQIDAMVKNPNGDLWTEQEVQEEIRLRLWTSWTAFQGTLRAIHEDITKLSKKVEDRSNVPQLNTALEAEELTSSKRKELISLISKEFKRVKFLFRQSRYEGLLKTVRDGVSRLEDLAAANIEYVPKRKNRSRVRLLDIVRELSSGLYRAVRSNLMCDCEHHISMRVSDYKGEITPDDSDEYVIQKLEMHLALTIPGSEFDDSLSAVIEKQWKELLIRSNPPLQVSVQTPNRRQNTANPIISSTNQITINFSLSQLSSSSTATMVQTETSLISDSTTGMSLEATAVDLAEPNTRPNIGLCHKLKTSSAAEGLDYFGTVSDRSPNTRRYSVSPSASSPGDGWKLVSLKDSLESLAYEKRLQLSVFIVKSVLQFYKAPWLPEMPSNRDIFFFQNGSSPDYERPFLIAKNDRSEAKPETGDGPIIGNPTLLATGVLLIELIKGKTIESLQTSEEILRDDPISLYTTASKLARELCQASSNFGTAVSRCIDGKIQGKGLDLGDPYGRSDFYSGIIALLEEDLKHVQRINADSSLY